MCMCVLVSWEVLMSDPLVLEQECQAVWGLGYSPRNHHLEEQQGLLIAEPSNLIKTHVLHGKVIRLP